MRILHVISSLDPAAGGTVAFVVNLAKAQVAMGDDVTILTGFRERSELAGVPAVRGAGVRVCAVGPCRTKLGRHPKMRRVARELVHGADVVHVHGVWEEAQYVAAGASARRGVPYVWSPHGMLDPWSLGQRRVRKYLFMAWRVRAALGRAALLHLTSEAERDGVAALGLSPPTVVEPAGVDWAEFETLPPAGAFRAKFPQLGDGPIVLFLGRLHYKKGLDLLIPAFARANVAGARLVLAGPSDPAYRAQLERLVADNGLSDRTVFAGMLHGPARIEALAAARVFALPSHQENFAIAAVESLAAGTPVLLSDRVDIHRVLADAGVCGVVQTNVESIAAGLTQWLTDAALWDRAAGRARAFVKATYDWREIAGRWRGHYAGVVGGRPAVAGGATRGGVGRPNGNGDGRAAPVSPPVLHVISRLDPSAGGPAVALVGLAAAQARAGLAVTVCSTFLEGDQLAAARSLEGLGVRLELIGPAHGKLAWHPDLNRRLDALVAAAGVVHVHGIWEEIQHVACRTAADLGVPFVVRPCGMLEPWSMGQRWVRKRLYLLVRLDRHLRRSAAIHVTSTWERDRIAWGKWDGGDAGRTIVEPNGLTTADYDGLERGRFRARHPELGSGPIAVFLGRLHYKKGLHLLIDAFAAGAPAGATLVVVGPDADGYRAELERHVDRAGLAGRVLFTGMLSGRDKLEALADADVMVLPSSQENFGNVVIESLAAGTPVVVSDQVAVKDAIGPFGTVCPLTVDAFAAGLRQWLSAPPPPATRDGARALARARFDWDEIAARWLAHYARLAAARAAAAVAVLSEWC